LLFTCMASPRTLSLAAIPSFPVKGRRSASSYPFAAGSCPGYPRAATVTMGETPIPPAEPSAPRKMRLSDFCNRLHFTSTLRTVRFPAASLARDASRCLALEHAGSPWAMDRAATRLGSPTPLARRANQVELRLTANLQLQPPPQLVTGPSRSASRQVSRSGTPDRRSPGGAAIDSPLRPASRPGRFQPRTEHATKPLTPSPAIQGGSESTVDLEGSPSKSRAEPDPRHPGPLDPPRPPPRQRTTTSSNQDAFHRREPPPRCDLRSRAQRTDHEELPVTASARIHPRSLPGGRARWLDPVVTRALRHVALRRVRRPGPSAARRLLQPKHSASTTTESTDPRCPSPALARPSVRSRAPLSSPR